MYVIEQWLNGTIIFVSETRIKRQHSSEAVNWKNPPRSVETRLLVSVLHFWIL